MKMQLNKSQTKDQLKNDLENLENSYQKNINKINQRLQNIDSNDINVNINGQNDSNLDSNENSGLNSKYQSFKFNEHDASNLQTPNRNPLNYDKNDGEKDGRDQSSKDQEMSWDLSNTLTQSNMELKQNAKTDKLDTIREVIREESGQKLNSNNHNKTKFVSDHDFEELSKPRFDSNHFDEDQNADKIDESINDNDDFNKNIVQAKTEINKNENPLPTTTLTTNPVVKTIEESYLVVKKMDLSKFKLKFCSGPISEELCPTVISYLDENKKLINFNIMKTHLIEDDVQAVIKETGRARN